MFPDTHTETVGQPVQSEQHVKQFQTETLGGLKITPYINQHNDRQGGHSKSEQQRGPITIHSKPLCNMKISLNICCKSRPTQDRGVTLKTSRSIYDMLRISKRHRCSFQSIWLRERRDSWNTCTQTLTQTERIGHRSEYKQNNMWKGMSKFQTETLGSLKIFPPYQPTHWQPGPVHTKPHQPSGPIAIHSKPNHWICFQQMLLARQSVNHGQMLETLTSPSNPMGNHSMPNAPVLAQDIISTTAESHSTQARMSNHTHKGCRLGGRWTVEIIAPFCSAMLEFSVSTVYKMPSYRISLFDVRLMRLPMYESAVLGPRPLPIVAETGL